MSATNSDGLRGGLGSAIRNQGLVEDRFDLRTQKIKQERKRDAEANTASQKITPEEIDQIAENLSCDKGYGQSPSPTAVLEPTRSCKSECCAKQKKEKSRWFAKTCELFMGGGI